MGKLIDYCTQITDGEHGTVVDDPNGEYFLLSSKNIGLNEIVITNDDRKINKKTFDSLIKKTKLDLGDVVISSVGTLGKTCVIEEKPNYVFQRSVGIIKPNPSLLDSYYLKYQLDLPSFQKRLNFLANGGLQKGLYIGDLEKLVVNCPDIEKQKRIVSILKSIDSKIVLNKKINAELESMAKTLYDYWFLQFEFPNEEGKPYKSSGGKMVYNEELKREIPKGWDVKKISDIIHESGKSKIQVNGATENGKYPFYTSGENILSLDEYFVDGFNIFLNTGGNPDIKAYMGKCAYSTDTWCISAADYSFILYYYLLKFIPQFEQLFFAGSGLKHLQKDILKSKCILLPDKDTLLKFNNTCATIWKQMTNKCLQNNELAKLRDYLLPLLMNGQVSY